jgi:hypothetical protein
MAEEKKEKKIIVDEDWKQQAQKEKEKLAEEEKKEKIPEKDQTEEQKQRGPLPEGDFAGLVSMLATQAMFAMGLIAPEGQKQRKPDLDLARYNIDMLQALQEKTKGNLDDKEENMLTQALDQLRMAYVKLSENAK